MLFDIEQTLGCKIADFYALAEAARSAPAPALLRSRTSFHHDSRVTSTRSGTDPQRVARRTTGRGLAKATGVENHTGPQTHQNGWKERIREIRTVKAVELSAQYAREILSRRELTPAHGRRDERPLVSVVVPAYNEAAILEENLTTLCDHLQSLDDEYRWEILVINDGSSDRTGEVADALARVRENIHVVHHVTNFGLGQAFKSAFARCRGDYVVALDADLSYSPDHIERLLEPIRKTRANVVVASPYMKGGTVSNVPWLRRLLSVWANRFLAAAARGHLSTLTSMVRAYDGRFLRTLDLTSTGMDINPEIIYKSMLLRARIEEVPSSLKWREPRAVGGRRSSMRVLRQVASVLVSGYLFRPVMFFILPGLLLLTFSAYVNGWMFFHFLNQYRNHGEHSWFFSRASTAVAAAYEQAPHTFTVGLMSLMVAIQLLSLGILALQSQRYFEQMFHLGTTIYRSSKAERGDESCGASNARGAEQ